MDQLLALHHTALRIRSNIQASPSNSDCTSINTDNAAKLVPEIIFILPSRIKRDREDVKKLQDMLSRFPIFDSENDENDELTCLKTRDVAPEKIKSALLIAEAHGTEKIRELVDTRLYRQKDWFHDTLKQSQSPTLTEMYMVENKKAASRKSQTIKTGRNLFQWLLVTKDSGRYVDLKNILSHERTPVPLALADTAGNIRPTNKAALGKILEQRITAEVLAVSALKTCSTIDGQALVHAIGKPSGPKSLEDLADAFNPGSKRHSLQAVELSQRIQAAVQIVSNFPAPSNGGPIYRFWGMPVMRTRWLTGPAAHKSG